MFIYSFYSLALYRSAASETKEIHNKNLARTYRQVFGLRNKNTSQLLYMQMIF